MVDELGNIGPFNPYSANDPYPGTDPCGPDYEGTNGYDDRCGCDTEDCNNDNDCE